MDGKRREDSDASARFVWPQTNIVSMERATAIAHIHAMHLNAEVVTLTGSMYDHIHIGSPKN